MNIKQLLKTHKSTRKIFGKRELEIIFNQLEGIPLKQSEKNRLSRDIRPKLEFIKDASEFIDDFKLEKNQDNKKIIRNALEIILQDESNEKISAVLLFGSHADNTFTKRSDIDICIVFDEELSLKEATLFRARISGELPDKIDIQVFNTLPLKIKKDIARNHKVLFSRDFDNINFSIKYLKDTDFFIRKQRIFSK